MKFMAASTQDREFSDDNGCFTPSHDGNGCSTPSNGRIYAHAREILEKYDAVIPSTKFDNIFEVVCSSSDNNTGQVTEEVVERIMASPLSGLLPVGVTGDCLIEKYKEVFPNGALRVAEALKRNEQVPPGLWMTHLAHVIDAVIVICNHTMTIQQVLYSEDRIKAKEPQDLTYITLTVTSEKGQCVYRRIETIDDV